MLFLFCFMKPRGIIIIVSILALVLIGLIVKSKFFSQPGTGALQISTTPKATVAIDGTQVGVTPFFDDKIKVGEHTIKLTPEATTDNLSSWEGKVTLVSGILTVINRNFGPTESESSGEILTLEKISRKDKSTLAVISVPDQAVVKLNGEPKGFAPLTLEDLTPADYEITVSSNGYEEKTVSAHTVAGYKLIVNIKLAQQIEGIQEATASGETTGSLTPTPSTKVTPTPKTTSTTGATATPAKPYVTVKDTPTGFLRVRVEPSTSATEAAQIKPGEMYPYLNEEKLDSGGNKWLKIEYVADKSGWVSGTYVTLVE